MSHLFAYEEMKGKIGDNVVTSKTVSVYTIYFRTCEIEEKQHCVIQFENISSLFNVNFYGCYHSFYTPLFCFFFFFFFFF